MNWRVQCAWGTAKALLPFQNTLRRIKQSVVPFTHPAGVDAWTIEEGLRQVEWVNAAGLKLDGATMLEIGAGWQLLIPVLFRLAGARRVILVDTMVLLTRPQLLRTVEIIKERAEMISGRLHVSTATIDSILQIEHDADLTGLLENLGFQYLAPSDARASPHADRSIDLITSRAALEHIPPDVIRAIFVESHRVLRSGGLMCHFVDNSDHWEHRDKSVTRVNFLQYEDWLWRLATINPHHYCNRLRHSDYLRLLAETGFEVVREEVEIDERSLGALKTLKLAGRFQGIPHRELAGISTSILARSR